MRRIIGALLFAGLLAGCGGVESDVDPTEGTAPSLNNQEQEQRSYACEWSYECKIGMVCCFGEGSSLGTCMPTCSAS
jgi:uncharacterized protein YceK